MSAPLQHVAVDLGASSGRVVAVSFDGARASLREIHRFPNDVIRVSTGAPDGRLSWDIHALWAAVLDGLRKSASEFGDTIASIGVDSWAVDYALLGPSGQLLRLPACYRDTRTARHFQRVRMMFGDEVIYARTGIQFLPFNTLYQLAADADDPDRPLAQAQTMLLIPDLLAYWLTGHCASERSNVSHTQLYDTMEQAWVTEFADALDIPTHILPEVRPSGSVLGPVLPRIVRETGLTAGTPVIAPATHDTGSAVVAIPMHDPETSAFISSGTWSLVGLELSAPNRSEAARRANFSNEAGAEDTTRFLRNVSGMWMIQECQRTWAAAGQTYSFPELETLTKDVKPLRCLVNPDDATFTAPGDMPARIEAWCADADQSAPDGPGAFVRAILESVALRSAQVVDAAADITGRTPEYINIVGGGAQNAVLNQFIADATDLPIKAGPTEATALGNGLVQAMALGEIADVAQLREVVGASFAPHVFTPTPDQGTRRAWRDARDRFDGLVLPPQGDQ